MCNINDVTEEKELQDMNSKMKVINDYQTELVNSTEMVMAISEFSQNFRGFFVV